ncbi:MAG TPA: hypothetical protein VGV18_08515, partial [Verrucomicrobiae bacterium]|nr:hypothetical protein [Verrucomicrobiae bacterium]
VTIGLLVTIIGAVSCAKGIKAISKVSIVPERTLDAVQSSETSASGSMEPAGAGLHQEVLDTRERIGEEQQELKHRISPLELTKSAIANVRKHPLSWGSAAVACTLTGGYFVGRRIWRN